MYACSKRTSQSARHGEDAAAGSQLYVSSYAVPQPATAAGASRAVPPIIRLLDNEGKLTHIAVAENNSYKLYRVSEAGANAAQMQEAGHAVSSITDTSKTADSSAKSSSPEGNLATTGLVKTETVTPSCSANYIIENVPAEQTLGALVGMRKFINPQRYGGSTTYTRAVELV
ncbi:unnamed protein product [Gongylonema pulchrum]|uniref:Transpeptidase domain-containing protein n=1 Tax=Gongylonema pulchrum TaxID=637853 RepID=A0A183DQA3_9BILA|nr:unnamed protein product [Gongylonema pulchrum]